MNDNTEYAEFQIGIDLGTCFTKASYYSFNKNERDLVSWETGALADNNEIIRSVIFITNNNYLYLTKPVNESSKRIKYFKMALADLNDLTGVLIDKPILPTVNIKNDAYKLYTAYYLAQIFSQIEKRIKEKYNVFLRDKEIKYSISLGIPVQYFDTQIKEIFEEVLQAFWYMYPKINKVEHIQNIDMYYTESLQAPKNFDIATVPELWAETVSLFTDTLTNDGYYAMFDIGGGTVDGALVNFSRQDGHSVIEFITAEVEPIGIEVAVREIKKTGNNYKTHKIRNKILSSKRINMPELFSLKNKIHTHTANVIVNAKYKGFNKNDCKMYLPVIICGGGKNSEWYRNTILTTYEIRQHKNCGIPPYSHYEINENPEQSFGITNRDKHRFLVALGLSIPHEKGPKIIGFPRMYPILEKTEEENVQSDSDDFQREKYGEII